MPEQANKTTSPSTKENPQIEPIVFVEEEKEDFDTLYEESVKGFRDQDIVNGTVTEITNDFVTVDIGFKSDCLIPANEFQNSEGKVDYTSTSYQKLPDQETTSEIEEMRKQRRMGRLKDMKT